MTYRGLDPQLLVERIEALSLLRSRAVSEITRLRWVIRSRRARRWAPVALVIGLPGLAMVAIGLLSVAGERVAARPTSPGIEARRVRGSLLTAVAAFRAAHPAEGCPGRRQLVASGYLDPRLSPRDPWGHPVKVGCLPTGAYVQSAGPDGVFHTRDDL